MGGARLKILAFLLFLIPAVAIADEEISIEIAPNGPGCRHVEIYEGGQRRGTLIEVTTLDDLDKPVDQRDSLIMAQVKSRLKTAENKERATIKSHLESGRYDYDRRTPR